MLLKSEHSELASLTWEKDHMMDYEDVKRYYHEQRLNYCLEELKYSDDDPMND